MEQYLPILTMLVLAFLFAALSFVASGLLAHEADEIATALAREGLQEVRRLEREGWAALLLSRDR